MASKEKGETHPAAEVPAYDDFMAAFRAEDVAAMLAGDLAYITLRGLRLTWGIPKGSKL